jgi:beta-glucosidase
MPSMSLPASGSQDRLIDEVCKVNKNVIIVNSTGTAIEMPWLNKVSAVIQSWFGGQESGNSIVDVLFGDKNPAGKLPFTIPKTIQDTPSYGNFPGDIEKLKVKYEEGIYIGYRFFDKHPERVQFPFGFGLSYTSFDINFVSLSEKVLRSNTVNSVAIKVHNTGTRTGSEVVQVYVSAPGNSIDVPTKQLAGYQKVELEAGETKVLNVSFGWESAAYWEQEKGKWIVESGKYKVLVGNSAAHVKKVAEFLVESTFFLDP